jgi:hypothetical protein
MHCNTINPDIDPLDPLYEDDNTVNENNIDGTTVVNDSELDALYLEQICKLFVGAAHTAKSVINATSDAHQQYSQAHYEKQPYHTSILSGIGWVKELLTGHPDRIQCELGV